MNFKKRRKIAIKYLVAQLALICKNFNAVAGKAYKGLLLRSCIEAGKKIARKASYIFGIEPNNFKNARLLATNIAEVFGRECYNLVHEESFGIGKIKKCRDAKLLKKFNIKIGCEICETLSSGILKAFNKSYETKIPLRISEGNSYCAIIHYDSSKVNWKDLMKYFNMKLKERRHKIIKIGEEEKYFLALEFFSNLTFSLLRLIKKTCGKNVVKMIARNSCKDLKILGEEFKIPFLKDRLLKTILESLDIHFCSKKDHLIVYRCYLYDKYKQEFCQYCREALKSFLEGANVKIDINCKMKREGVCIIRLL